MIEAFLMVAVGLIGGAASAMGTLPAVLVALFGDTSQLVTTPTGGATGGPNILPPLLPFANQTFQSGGNTYQVNMGSDGQMKVVPYSPSAGSSPPPNQPAKPPAGGGGGKPAPKGPHGGSLA